MSKYNLRPYTSSDVQAAVDVVNASSRWTVGFPRAVVDAVGNLRLARYVPLSGAKTMAVNSLGEVVGYAYVADKENGIVTEVGGGVHPDHWGQGIGQLLLAWADERAKILSDNAPAGVRCVLQSNLFEAEAQAIKLFTDSGYIKMREWVHMELELSETPVIQTLPENMTLREMDLDNDWDIVGPAMDEAFADHWGSIPPSSVKETPEEIQDDENDEDETPTDDSFSNAPGYCFIILDGEKVAGGTLCNAKLVERQDAGRIGSVFVRREYRRRGIGQILMKTAFNAFWQNGVKHIILDTDSESFSHSTKFYDGLGMKPYRHEFLYEKEIRPGKEIRLMENNK